MKKTLYSFLICMNSIAVASSAADFKSAPGIETIKVTAQYSNPHHMCAGKCGLCKTKELFVIISRNSGFKKLKEAFATQLSLTEDKIQVAQSSQAIDDEPVDLEKFNPQTKLHVSLKNLR